MMFIMSILKFTVFMSVKQNTLHIHRTKYQLFNRRKSSQLSDRIKIFSLSNLHKFCSIEKDLMKNKMIKDKFVFVEYLPL